MTTINESAAVATPWTFDGGDIWAPNGLGPGIGANVCRMKGDRERIKANAALIVRAVNSHAELVLACSQATRYFENQGPVLGDSDAAHDERMVRQAIRAALAKAETT